MSESTQGGNDGRDWRFYVGDMISFSEKVLAYTEGFDRQRFEANGLTYDATVRNLELIGEAATRIPASVREFTPHIQWRQIISKFIDHPGHPGLRDISRATRILLDTGAQMEEIEAAAWEYIFCPAVYIQQIEDGTFSYSWRLDPELMPDCIAELRTWAIERFGSLEVEFTLPKKFIWQIYYWR